MIKIKTEFRIVPTPDKSPPGFKIRKKNSEAHMVKYLDLTKLRGRYTGIC